MQYTITSRGRPIGVTDLGFRYRPGTSRMGWFHPNPAGEQLMPVASSVGAASRQYASRFRREPEVSDFEARNDQARLLADIGEAIQHAEALLLELRDETGAVIPTEYIGIQDTEQLIAWADTLEPIGEGEPWEFGAEIADPPYDPLGGVFDDEPDTYDDAELCFGHDSDDEVIFGDGFANEWAPWSVAADPPTPPARYQIFVSLVDASAIP